MNKPVDLPSKEKLKIATNTIRDWMLHYYQLLLFQEPKLTHVNHPKPFKVSIITEYGGFLRVQIEVPDNPEYTFNIYSGLELSDEEVLEKCAAIQSAVAEGKKKAHSLACCGLAIKHFCVCTYSYSCKIHGGKCVGSHD